MNAKILDSNDKKAAKSNEKWRRLTALRYQLYTFVRSYLLRWWVAIGVLTAYCFIRVFDLNLLPDLLGLSSIQSFDYFSIIVDATASIFGILIAVVLLTFELVKHSLFKRAGANILNNPIVTNFLSLGILTVILAFISFATVQNFDDASSLTVGYFVGYTFLAFVLSIYPFMTGLLYSTSGLRNAMGQIERLQLEDFDVTDFESNSISLLEDSNTPLFQLRSELITMVRENDFQGYNWILKSLNGKVIELQGNGKNRNQMETIQGGLTLVWKGANLEAVRLGNLQYFDSVWESMLTLYVNAIDKKHPYLHYQQIDFYKRDFMSFLNRNKLNDNLATGAKVLSNIFRFSLEENCPKQELLYDLYQYFKMKGGDIRNSDAHLQWDDIVDFVSSIFEIQRMSIDNKDKSLFDVCSREISILMSRLSHNEFPKLKQLQIAYLLIKMTREKVWNAELALTSNFLEKVHEALKVDEYILVDAISKKEIYVKHIMQMYGRFIIEFHRKRKLEFFTTLSDWKGIALLNTKNYRTNHLAKQSIDYIIGTLKELKNEIEENQLPEANDDYQELKKSLEYLRKLLTETRDTDEICEKLATIINSFKKIKKLKSGTVQWDADVI